MPSNDCLLIKTASEISLKSNFVRRFFTKKLVQSIKFALKRNKIECSEIIRGGGRLYLFCEKTKKAQAVLSTISGIHAIALAQHFQNAGYKEIEKQALNFSKGFLKKGDAFALSVNTSNNNAFSRKDLENRLGAAIQKAIPGLKVNLTKPEKKIFLEIRKEDFFIYTEQLRCLGGLPLGVEGSVAFHFSGKEDELLAAFLLMHRGCNIFPVTKKPFPKIKKFLEKLVPFNDYRTFILTEEKNLPQLIEERRIQAIGTADYKTDEKSLASYKQFDSKQNLVVLRPLLLFPEEKKKKLEKMFH